MICQNCGLQIKDSDIFCQKCGAKLDRTDKTPVAAVTSMKIDEKITKITNIVKMVLAKPKRKLIAGAGIVVVLLVVAIIASNVASGVKLDDEQFIELCKTGTVQEVARAIKGGSNVNAKDSFDRTALMFAAMENSNPEILTVLLDNGADVNAKIDGGVTTLMFVARGNSNPEILTVLLDNDADVNAKTNDGVTALMVAARYNSNLEVLTVLLDNGADINAKDSNGLTALMSAAINNSNSEILTVLLDNGADINAIDSNGLTALMWAAINNSNPEILTVLLDNGADVNAIDSNGFTALMWAAKENSNPEIVTILLDNVADVNAKDYFDGTAIFNKEVSELLHEASRVTSETTPMSSISAEEFIELSRFGTPQEVEAAIKAGADVNAKAKSDYMDDMTVTALMVAVVFNPEIIPILLQYGVDVNAKGTGGSTALIYAVGYDNPYMVALLLETGADANAVIERDAEAIEAGMPPEMAGLTALMLAIEYDRDPKIIEMLRAASGTSQSSLVKLSDEEFIELSRFGTPQEVEAAIKGGSNVNARSSIGPTALMFAAASSNDPEVLTVLLENDAAINAQDPGGSTALMYAAMYSSNPEVLTVLLENGADINAIDSGGYTTLMKAVYGNPNPEIIAILLENGADVNAKATDGTTALMSALENDADPEIIEMLRTASGTSASSADTVSSDEILDLGDLIRQFNENAIRFNRTYRGQRITVAGIITAMDEATIDGEAVFVIELSSKDVPEVIICIFDESQIDDVLDLKRDTQVVVQGEYRGDNNFSNAVFSLHNCRVMESAESQAPEAIALSPEEFLKLCASGTLQQIAEAIRNGADVNCYDMNGTTALMYAARENANAEIITALIQNGAEINDSDRYNMTPLLEAVMSNPNPDVVLTLIEYGADMNVHNFQGESVFDLAMENENPDILQTLRGLFSDNFDLTSARITGNNVNVRNAPNTQGQVLFQVNDPDAEFLIIEKTPYGDSSGRVWYKIIYRWGEDDEFGAFDQVAVPAYISGEFLKIEPLSPEVREDWLLYSEREKADLGLW